MGGSTPKVLLTAAGRPLLAYVIDAVRTAGIERTIAVVGVGREQVQADFADAGVEFAVQPEQRGTADAVLACRELLADDEQCVVVCGDAPLMTGASIRRLADARQGSAADLAVLTAQLDSPFGYGRIIRGPDGSVDRIVEERDATDSIRSVKEVNSGFYAFIWGRIRPVLGRMQPSPVSNEYYLTDAVGEIRAEGGTVIAVVVDDAKEILGANTPEQLSEIASELTRRRRRPQT